MKPISIKNSLSKRILFHFFLISFALILFIFYTFEEVGKEAFKNMEKSKAEVVVDTMIPTVSMNLSLGFYKKINDLVKQVVEHNKNILGMTIMSHNKVIVSYMKQNIQSKDYFVFTKKITKPNSNEDIGRVHLIYSYEHYKEIVDKYSKLLWLFIAGVGLLLILFSIYLEKLLSPLRKIVAELRNYSLNRDFQFPFIARDDEIGAIVAVLQSMQNKIKKFAQYQEEINKELEKKVEEKTKELKDRLYIDSLTGLFNRIKLQEDLAEQKDASLVIINIDDFKEINDLFGHKIGDRILQDFSKKLKSLLNTSNPKLYRIGGDEFALLFRNRMSENDLHHFLNIFIKKIENMIFFYGDKELSLHVSIGAVGGKEGALEKADIALKKARKNRKVYEIYDHEIDAKVEKEYARNIMWVKKFKEAIELDRVVPFFQPIVSTSTMRIKGYESLIRILDDDGSVVSPAVFLDIAKKSKFYYRLTEVMIEKSCEYFQDSHCSFSINLSILDIMHQQIVHKLKEAIARYQVHNKLILEIVESEGIENYDLVYRFVREMKEIGCQIAIDDFGSGYSNFEHILKLPIDYIKIDGSLVKNICIDKDSELIVSTIVDFAKKKKIKTVSEFVSSEEIFLKIKSLGVDYAQGFYFGKPKQFVSKECIF